MFRSSNLQKWMTMMLFDLAFFAVIKVRADTALVANSLNGLCVTSITCDSIMDLRSLISGPLSEILDHESLEGLSSV